jgi:hypothetical protein
VSADRAEIRNVAAQYPEKTAAAPGARAGGPARRGSNRRVRRPGSGVRVSGYGRGGRGLALLAGPGVLRW